MSIGSCFFFFCIVYIMIIHIQFMFIFILTFAYLLCYIYFYCLLVMYKQITFSFRHLCHYNFLSAYIRMCYSSFVKYINLYLNRDNIFKFLHYARISFSLYFIIIVCVLYIYQQYYSFHLLKVILHSFSPPNLNHLYTRRVLQRDIHT